MNSSSCFHLVDFDPEFDYFLSLTQFDGTSPKDLARELVTRDLKDATDDRTALVVRIDTRKNRLDHPDG